MTWRATFDRPYRGIRDAHHSDDQGQEVDCGGLRLTARHLFHLAGGSLVTGTQTILAHADARTWFIVFNVGRVLACSQCTPCLGGSRQADVVCTSLRRRRHRCRVRLRNPRPAPRPSTSPCTPSGPSPPRGRRHSTSPHHTRHAPRLCRGSHPQRRGGEAGGRLCSGTPVHHEQTVRWLGRRRRHPTGCRLNHVRPRSAHHSRRRRRRHPQRLSRAEQRIHRAP